MREAATVSALEENLVKTLREQAQQRPESEAYCFLPEGEENALRLTYRDLDVLARGLAVKLSEHARIGERALLLYSPGPEYLAAFFGCLYAGVIAVPAYPPTSRRTLPRLLSMLSDARPAVILTSRQVLGRTQSFREQVPELSGLEWIVTDELAEPVLAADWKPPAIGGETTAFLQYTSGSTSQPKGVRVTHGNVVHNERMIARAFGQDAESVIVGWLPLYHDMGLIGNVLQPLFLGARCILMPPLAFLKRPGRWLEAISRYGATTSGGPDFAYDLCVRKVTAAERRSLDLSSWTVAFSGAEPVRAATLERFVDAFAECGFRRKAFYPCYGLAEATLFVSGGLVNEPPVVETVASAALERHQAVPADPQNDGVRRLVSCGHAWLGQELCIVDPDTHRPLGVNQVGEIWVAGPSVAAGYWDKPRESERVFRAWTRDGAGPFLRTGDLGFLSSAGELVVTGRVKDLVILRGRNHYPQDFELSGEASHPALRPGGSAAFAVELDEQEHLVIVLEAERSFRGDFAQVVAAVRHAVADQHQVRARTVVLIRAGSLPKTSSGKVRRQHTKKLFLEGELHEVARSERGLPLTGVDAEVADGGFDREQLDRLPASERRPMLVAYLRRVVAGLVRVALDQVDPVAPLSALGFDSLMAVELKNRVDSDLGCELDLGELLRGRSLGELSEHCLSVLEAPRADGLEQADAPASGILSHGQRAMWFLQQLEPESTAYNIVVALRLRAELDLDKLESVLRRLALRHPALRTAFHASPEGPRQILLDDRWVELEVEDAAGWSEAEVCSRVESQTPFDLEYDPLMRVHVLRRGDQDHVVVLSVHHIIADLGSLGVLLSELRALYAQPGAAVEVLPLLSATYGDHVRWQQQWLDSPAGEEAWRYWRQALTGELPVLALPTDRPRPPHQSFEGFVRGLMLSPSESAGIRQLAVRHRTTLYAVLLSALQSLLARYSGQREVLVGTPAANRNRADLAGVVGYFVNPIVMRATVCAALSFDDLLVRTGRTAREALEHKDYPFPLLVERLQPQRDPSRSPVFQVLFVVQRSDFLSDAELAAFVLGRSGVEVDFAGLPGRSFPLARQVAPFDLSLVSAETSEGLGFSLLYNAGLFHGTTAERFLRHLRVFLETAVLSPYRPVSRIAILSPGEHHQLLDEWNDSAMASGSGFVHRRFEVMASEVPGAPALVCSAVTWTYRELNERANRVARALGAAGASPEAPVAVLSERGCELAAALIGILKAGAVYLPLDPRLPDRRLRQVLARSGSSLALVAGESESTMVRVAAYLGAGTDVRILRLEDLLANARPPSGNLSVDVYSDQLAYVIFTSGSTGLPKGAMLTHRGMHNHLAAKIEALALGPRDVVAQNASQSFDVSVWQFLAALLVGGAVRIFPDEVAHDPIRLMDHLVSSRVTIFETVPSLLRPLLAHAEQRASSPFESLRCLISTGEALPPTLCRQWFGKYSSTPLVNAYGPTECSDNVSHAFFRQAPLAQTPRISIGRPVVNLTFRVLGRALEPVPCGVAGELRIGGHGVGRGYLHDPRRTAAVFQPDLFAVAPGAAALQNR